MIQRTPPPELQGKLRYIHGIGLTDTQRAAREEGWKQTLVHEMQRFARFEESNETPLRTYVNSTPDGYNGTTYRHMLMTENAAYFLYQTVEAGSLVTDAQIVATLWCKHKEEKREWAQQAKRRIRHR
jgi:hypothetical protein